MSNAFISIVPAKIKLPSLSVLVLVKPLITFCAFSKYKSKSSTKLGSILLNCFAAIATSASSVSLFKSLFIFLFKFLASSNFWALTASMFTLVTYSSTWFTNRGLFRFTPEIFLIKDFAFFVDIIFDSNKSWIASESCFLLVVWSFLVSLYVLFQFL